MTEREPAEWRELSTEIGDDELVAWTARIAAPVAVTGASGFVGSHLVEALVRGRLRPRVLLRDPARLPPTLRGAVDVVRGDLEDVAALDTLLRGAGTVFHLAGLVRAPDEVQFDRANRVGTERLVANCGRACPDTLFVYVSSLAAAGPSREPGGNRPDAAAQPVSAYGRSKLAGERAVTAGCERWVVVRPPAIYGPRDIDVLQFFRLLARGVVPVPSGERWVTLTHVADVVRGILAAGSGDCAGRVLYVGDPVPQRMDELLRAMARAGGLRARVVPVPPALVRLGGLGGDLLHRLGFRSVALTSDKARELLARHWSASTAESLRALRLEGFVPFSSGTAATWAWYRDQGILPRVTIRDA
ncbi:MAG: NAD-dependent epimerase/dehydratase family protein [Acidobacteria bacterium]|nr:NAD-dependent epimerase/dehydratase family protein [Acidobacteriota bacterium]